MLPMFRAARLRVARRIAADPTSTALLLAGPAAVDLWPGVRRVGQADGRLIVELAPPAAAGGEVVAVRVLPPRRTPTSYVTSFDWSGSALPAVEGRLTLAYAPTADGMPVTHAVLELDVDDDAARSQLLPRLAERFLANLARAAEMRNRAA